MSNQFFRTLDELIEERENQQKRLEDENARNYQFTIHDTRETIPDGDGMVTATSEDDDTGVFLRVDVTPDRDEGFGVRITQAEEVVKYGSDGVPYREYNVGISEVEYITLGDMRRLAHTLLSLSSYLETPGGMEEVTVTTQEKVRHEP